MHMLILFLMLWSSLKLEPFNVNMDAECIDTTMCTNCRADRNASKFLKKELRLPKKLTTGTNMSSSTFSSGGLKGRSGGFGRFRRKA